MYQDLICERVEKCKQGADPSLIEEFEYSYFILGEHQFYKGYSQLILKEHVREIHELPDIALAGLMIELKQANLAIEKTFSPWKMNNQCLGNQQQHVHLHIIPRYKDDPNKLEQPFTEVIKGDVRLADYFPSKETKADLIRRIRNNLK